MRIGLSDGNVRKKIPGLRTFRRERDGLCERFRKKALARRDTRRNGGEHLREIHRRTGVIRVIPEITGEEFRGVPVCRLKVRPRQTMYLFLRAHEIRVVPELGGG